MKAKTGIFDILPRDKSLFFLSFSLSFKMAVSDDPDETRLSKARRELNKQTITLGIIKGIPLPVKLF